MSRVYWHCARCGSEFDHHYAGYRDQALEFGDKHRCTGESPRVQPVRFMRPARRPTFRVGRLAGHPRTAVKSDG